MLKLRELIEPLVSQGMAAKDIYIELKKLHPNVCRAPVYRAVHRLGGKITRKRSSDVVKKRISKMVANGLRYRDIGQILGLSAKQVNNLVHRYLDVESPYIKNKKMVRETISTVELERIYTITLRSMLKRFKHFEEDVPSAVADAIIEIQSKPRTEKSYAECFGIAQRRLIDHVRSRKGRTGSKRQSVFVDGFPEFYEPEVEGDYTTDKEDEINWMRGKISLLESPYREAITSYLDNNLNYSSVAIDLGVSQPTAAKYVQTAIQRIKDDIE